MSEQAEIVVDEGAETEAPIRKGKMPMTRAQRTDREEEGKGLSDWIRSLGVGGPGGAFKAKVTRLDPKTYAGKKVDGFLQSYDDEYIDEAILQERHGGGRFQIQIQQQNEKGSWNYVKARNVDVAGDPKPVISYDASPVAAPAPNAGDALAQQAMNTMKGILDEQRRDGQRGGAADGDAISKAVQAATGPLLDALQMMRGELDAARRTATEARNVPPDPVRDMMLKKALDDDSSRIAGLRASHESEIRQLRQSMIDTEARLHDRHDREVTALRADYKSQMDTLKHAYEGQIQTLKHSYEGQIGEMKSSHSREISSITMVGTTQATVGTAETKRMERELSELRVEVKDLRAKKDKSIFEVIKEVDEVKDILGSGDDEKKAAWERALDAIGGSPAAIAFLTKIGGGGAPDPAAIAAAQQQAQLAAAQAQQQQIPPPFTPFQAPDGQWYTHDGQGNVRPYVRKKKPRPEAATAPSGAAGPEVHHVAPDGTPVAGPSDEEIATAQALATQNAMIAQAAAALPRETVQMAVTYLENAFRGDQKPETVASSLRSQGLVPGDIYQFIREQGVDVLLDKVARLEASSPLATQKGRRWVRDVAKSLIEAA